MWVLVFPSKRPGALEAEIIVDSVLNRAAPTRCALGEASPAQWPNAKWGISGFGGRVRVGPQPSKSVPASNMPLERTAARICSLTAAHWRRSADRRTARVREIGETSQAETREAKLDG